MERELLKHIIVENREFIQDLSLNERPFVFEQKGNYVFVGVRQAGKSYLLYQRMQQLLKQGYATEQMIYLNFDDERIVGMQSEELDIILQAGKSMTEKNPVLFLDEIQNIKGWENFARRLANQKYNVYITGSNAKMLSSEIATTLGGRYFLQNVWPYSFKEYLSAKSISSDGNSWQYGNNLTKVIREFSSFFYYGGFPELVDISDKRAWLTGIYNKIFLSDVIVRNSIRNEQALRMTVRRLAYGIGQSSSFNRISNLVKSSGIKTNVASILNYVQYLKESNLIFGLDNFVSKFVEKETIKKYYFVDNGLLNLFLTNPETALLENLCAVHLYKIHKEQVYFYNKDFEVDFYVPEESKAIQVCYNLSDEMTLRREIQALEKLDAIHNLNELYIITYDTEKTILLNNGKTVYVVPVWKWILM
ncbi:MAG: ATP-binding protein [Bacteroidales bacterium]|nr:ATP-binding protein [Bacteroidales bacterium]